MGVMLNGNHQWQSNEDSFLNDRPPPSRRSAISSFIVMDMMAKASALERREVKVMRLEAGAPDTAPPPAILKHLAHNLTKRNFGYTDSTGTPQLKERIAWLYQHRYELEIDPSGIVISSGSSACLTLALLAAFEHGDVIALPRPCYPAYRPMANALGLRVVDMPLSDEDGWCLTARHIEQCETKPSGIILTNPANPTGALMDEHQLATIADYCRHNRIRIISDEIYHDVTDDDHTAHSILSFDPDAIVTSGFSKFFALPGWRVGWMIAPVAFASSLLALQQNLYVAPPSAGQELATAMLQENVIATMKHHVRRWNDNRNVLLRFIEQSPLSLTAQPRGGFYIYCDAAAVTHDSVAWCDELLHRHHVALAAGVDFDPVDGNRFVRFSFCRPNNEITTACEILSDVFNS